MVTVNAQGLMEKIGVAPLAIKSGPMKDAGSPFRALTGPELAVFQNIIDEMYGRFVGLIVQSRKLPEDRVRALADGRVYTAEQALRLGLVDRIGYLEDVVKLARDAAKLDEARVVMYHRPKEYRSNLYSSTLAAATADSTLAQFAAVLGGSGPRFLYLWWP
jgi:protease-4